MYMTPKEMALNMVSESWLRNRTVPSDKFSLDEIAEYIEMFRIENELPMTTPLEVIADQMLNLRNKATGKAFSKSSSLFGEVADPSSSFRNTNAYKEVREILNIPENKTNLQFIQRQVYRNPIIRALVKNPENSWIITNIITQEIGKLIEEHRENEWMLANPAGE